MLIQMGAIEEGQAMAVLGEMARYPIENHADALGVAAIHKGAKFIRRAKAAGGRIPARDLIAPGAIEGMLRNRHQLDVGKAAGQHIGNQPIGQFRIGEQAGTGLKVGGGHRGPGTAVGFDVGLVGAGVHPAAQVHLIHRDRLVERIGVVPLGHPAGVAPAVGVEFGHHRTGLGPDLMAEAVGVGLLVAVPIRATHFVFVNLAGLEARDEQLPAAPQPRLHRMVAPIPAVEVAQHGDTAGVGRPETKLNPGDAVVLGGMGAHAPPDVVVVAFSKQQPVQLPHPLMAERPRIVLHVFDAAAPDAQLIGAAWIALGGRLKHPGVVGRGHGQGLASDQQLNLLRLRHPDPHHPAAALEGLGTQDGQGVVMAALSQPEGIVHHRIEPDQHRLQGSNVAGSLGAPIRPPGRIQRAAAGLSGSFGKSTPVISFLSLRTTKRLSVRR